MSEYKRWSYTGPIYYYGNKIAEKCSYYTMAKNWNAARRNFVYKIANGDKAYYYDIVDSYIGLAQAEESTTRDEATTIIKCETCGTELNPLGECPVCDYGEYDLLD